MGAYQRDSDSELFVKWGTLIELFGGVCYNHCCLNIDMQVSKSM